MKKFSLLLMAVAFCTAILVGTVSCSLFINDEPAQDENSVQVASLKLSKTSVSIGVGGMEYMPLTVNPANATGQITYSCNIEGIISIDGDRYGVSITGLKSGNTVLKATASNGVTAACVVSVTGVDPSIEKAPQITSSTIALELEQGVSKRVQVSLTGGTSADMASFRWNIDKSSIATIEGSGQSVYVTAKSNGIAQVTVTHPLANYPYQFCIFVKPEAEKAVYITNTQNIVTLDRNKGDTSVSVNLVNGNESDNAFFSWKILNNAESEAACINITANGRNCIVMPLKQGTAFIEVTHPKAAYPYLIRCKVVTIVENVIIEPSVTKVTLDGTVPQSITAQLTGGSGTFNPLEFSWTTSTPDLLELSAFQDSCGVQGKANGTGKLIVSHPAAKYPREILVFVKNHPAGSIDASVYITTGQDYIRTKEGADEIPLTIALVGGEIGDEAGFTWTIDKPEVIGMTTANGTVVTRSALASRIDAQALITPKKEGTAVISITHPKASVPKEVLVKVLSSTAVLEEPLYIIGADIVGLVIGNKKELSMTLNGNVQIGDERNVTWKSEDESVAFLSAVNGTAATVNAQAAGETYVTVNHPKAAYPKKILVYTAATEEELAAKKLLYTSKSQYNVVANGNPERLYVYAIGIDDERISQIQWANSNPSVASITIGTSNKECIVKGIAAGTATVTATHPECSKPVEFTITVLPAGTDLGVVPSPVYLTTTQNVVQFTQLNESKTISVTPVKLAAAEYRNIRWKAQDESVCEVIANGEKATVTSKKEGVTTILVSHPESENELPVTVRVGSQFISPEVKTPYVSASQDVLGLVNGASGQRITATLNNATSAEAFSWHIDNQDVATITPLNGSCFIIPKTPGQAQLTISHPAAIGMDAKVLILVANSEEELASLPYLTTSQNVVSLRMGSQQNVQVRIANADNPLQSGYTWKAVDNPSIVQIISNGSQAVFKGLSSGIAHVEVSHTDCKYPLTITAEVKEDTADAAANPYITNSQNLITMNAGGSSKSINVTLTGGTVEDNTDFNWSYDKSNVISMVSNGQNAVVRGLAAGECLITVTHPKARYPYPIKVLVEQPVTGASVYIKTTPANIISMKPADPEQTITASLVGGTAEDAYGFKWYADNYNVIDITATANTAVITPRSEGTATVTITHPKAAYPGELTVRVTEYSTFEFAMTNITMIEGNTQFVSMKVPAMEAEYGGRVMYKTDNEKIVSISGTNKVAQITAVAAGTTTVTATSPSGAKSDMMVYVKKAAEQALPYITSASNVLSMKITDTQRSVSAQIVGQGIVPTDQYNLQWTIDNPAVAQLIGTSGSNILIRPLKAGETTLRVSHAKTDSVYTMYIEVTGSAGGIALNKNYVSLETGKTVELSATIDNGTTNDYANIAWNADKVNGQDIVNILGSGKTVAVYGLAAGRTTVTAEWNGKTAKCDVIVESSRQFAFDTQTMRVQPGQTKTFKYTLVPDTADIQWFTNTNEYITYAVDPASKTVSVTGVKEDPSGNVALTTLSGISQSMKSSISITTSWDYKLNLGRTMIKAEPRYDDTNPDKFIIPYEVNPENARIDVQISKDGIADYVVDTAKKQIILTPRGEGNAVVNVTAYNTDTGTAFPNMARQCNLYFAYDKLTLVPSVISKTGSFSRYDKDSGILIMGDGEQAELNFTVAQPNVDWTITSFNIVKKDAASPISFTAGSVGTSYKIKHPNDIFEYQYRIIQGYKPVYYHGTLTIDGLTKTVTRELQPTDFKWSFETDWWRSPGGGTPGYVYYWGLTSQYSNTSINLTDSQHADVMNAYFYNADNDYVKTSYTRLDQYLGERAWCLWWVQDEDWNARGKPHRYGYQQSIFYGRSRDESLDGKIFSVSEFERIAWYYCPGRSDDNNFKAPDFNVVPRILTENISAVKEVTQSTNVLSSNNTDQLEIIITHNGKTEKFTVPVYTEIRGCSYTQK